MSAGRFFREQSLVIVHVSTTCDEQQVCVSRESAEIIELAWILVDASSLEERTRGSVLVRPVNTPVTDLCTNTTTLTWSDLENAGTLKEALGIVDAAIRGATTSKDVSFSFIVLDPFDLRVQIPREARDKSLALPTYLQHPRLYDLRSEYGKWQRIHPEAMLFNPGSLSNICAALDVDTTDLIHGGHSHLSNPQAQFALTEGHSALDHCTIIHRILRALIKRSEPVEQHSTLFKFPVDAKADITSFFEEKSKVLHLSGLAYDTTQSELESWFTQHGGRPIAFWTLRTPDQHKPSGTGYAIFSSHQEASDSLTMNGRALGDRTIEVSPSSPRVLDRAAEILTPFPPSKNRPRPGDWTCPSCGFSNFQRRTACFRCSYPSGGGTLDPMTYYPPPSLHSGGMGGGFAPPAMHSNSMRPMTGGHVPFRAGDWACQNCTYHNFARNSVCLKCSMPRAPQPDINLIRYDDYNTYSMGGIADELGRI